MPTGYTTGILDGSLKTFADFARICTRAMGATIHMRDEALDVNYQPRLPGDYHLREIEKAKLILSEELTADQYIAYRKSELEDKIRYNREAIEKDKTDKARLESFLQEATAYTPPTPEHEGFKKFMISQIEDTISFDTDRSWLTEDLKKAESDLLNLDADKIKAEKHAKALKDLKYHESEYEKELKRCHDSNEWVKQAFESIADKSKS